MFKKIAETVMARDLNPDYRTARDSTERLHSLPFMAAGNLNALNNVLTGIGMGHQGLPVTASGIVWGNNAGEDKRIILSQEAAAQGMPSLIGYGLRDAVYRLERMGLRVKATGVGHVVRQSIAPGTKVQRGMRVGLLLSLNDDRHLSENEDLAFRRMYGLPIEKKDSTQKTADSSRTAAVKSEHSVVSNSDNKKTKPTPANHSGTSEKNKEQKSGSSSTSKSTASTSKGSASSSSSSASKNNKNEASSNKKTPKGSKS